MASYAHDLYVSGHRWATRARGSVRPVIGETTCVDSEIASNTLGSSNVGSTGVQRTGRRIVLNIRLSTRDRAGKPRAVQVFTFKTQRYDRYTRQ